MNTTPVPIIDKKEKLKYCHVIQVVRIRLTFTLKVKLVEYELFECTSWFGVK